ERPWSSTYMAVDQADCGPEAGGRTGPGNPSVITPLQKPARGGAVEPVQRPVREGDVPFVAAPGVDGPPVARSAPGSGELDDFAANVRRGEIDRLRRFQGDARGEGRTEIAKGERGRRNPELRVAASRTVRVDELRAADPAGADERLNPCQRQLQL